MPRATGPGKLRCMPRDDQGRVGGRVVGVPRCVYRFVPLGDDGKPNENARYMLTSEEPFVPGSRIRQSMLGHPEWEVLQVSDESGSLLEARDSSGRELPLAGTVICRPIV